MTIVTHSQSNEVTGTIIHFERKWDMIQSFFSITTCRMPFFTRKPFYKGKNIDQPKNTVARLQQKEGETACRAA